MGSRTDDKLKEIEQLRESLGAKLGEIEGRFPIAGMGKKIGMALAGSSVASSVLAFGLRRARGKRKDKKAQKRGRGKDQPAIAPAVVTVNFVPKGAAWIAAAGLAGFAGLKIYEAVKKGRNGDEAPFRPAVVTNMPESGRYTGN